MLNIIPWDSKGKHDEACWLNQGFLSWLILCQKPQANGHILNRWTHKWADSNLSFPELMIDDPSCCKLQSKANNLHGAFRIIIITGSLT